MVTYCHLQVAQIPDIESADSNIMLPKKLNENLYRSEDFSTIFLYKQWKIYKTTTLQLKVQKTTRNKQTPRLKQEPYK